MIMRTHHSYDHPCSPFIEAYKHSNSKPMGQECSDQCQRDLRKICQPEVFYRIENEFSYELHPQNTTSPSQVTSKLLFQSRDVLDQKVGSDDRNACLSGRKIQSSPEMPPNRERENEKEHVQKVIHSLGIIEDSLSTLNSYELARVRENLMKKYGIDIAKLNIRGSQPKGNRVQSSLERSPSCQLKRPCQEQAKAEFTDELRTSERRKKYHPQPPVMPLTNLVQNPHSQRNESSFSSIDLSGSISGLSGWQSVAKPNSLIQMPKQGPFLEEECYSESSHRQMPTYLAHPWQAGSLASSQK